MILLVVLKNELYVDNNHKISFKVVIDGDKFVYDEDDGKTAFACKKSRAFCFCEQMFNFCPYCGDAIFIKKGDVVG